MNFKSVVLIFVGIFTIVAITCAIYFVASRYGSGAYEIEELSMNKSENMTSENITSRVIEDIPFSPFAVIDAPVVCEKGMRFDAATSLCRKVIPSPRRVREHQN